MGKWLEIAGYYDELKKTEHQPKRVLAKLSI